MPFTGLFRTAVLGVALIKEWDVFHPPDFLGVPAIAGGRIYSGACETRGELNPAFFYPTPTNFDSDSEWR